jgi:hypothetical protein
MLNINRQSEGLANQIGHIEGDKSQFASSSEIQTFPLVGARIVECDNATDLDAEMQANRPAFPASSFPTRAGRSGARSSSEIWP